MDVDREATASPTPKPNGTAAETNGDSSAPPPPPHRTPTSPPPPVDAEACKAAGNKFFKAKDYTKAIQEYTKGMCTRIFFLLEILVRLQLSVLRST